MKKKRENTEYIGYLLIFVTGALWGTIGIFVKEMAACGADASLISFFRIVFAFLIMLVLTTWKRGVKAFRIGKRTLLFSILLGVVCHGIYNIFYSMAVTLAGVSVSAVLLNIAPVFTFMVSRLCFSEKANPKKIIALVLNIVGCTLAATGGNISGEMVSLTGILCGAGAGFCYAMTAILGRFAMDESDSMVVSTYSYFFAALMLLIPARPWAAGAVISGKLLGIGFLFALIPTAMAYILYYNGLKRVTESSKVPVIASVETVVAALFGIWIYQERLNGVSLAGILIVLVSIYIMNARRKMKTEEMQDENTMDQAGSSGVGGTAKYGDLQG